MKLSGAIWACLTAFGVVDFVAASDSDHPKFKDQWSALKYADKLNRGVRPGTCDATTQFCSYREYHVHPGRPRQKTEYNVWSTKAMGLCDPASQCKESGGKCFSRGGKGKVFCDPAEVMAAVAMAELASDEWQNS
ncbi:hypothetical protein PLICBS_005098 [Purpureocillium lilacinum]|uniref:uncharacterized protein n=1 Tax=Purpureocillium lilacinum TaxID=33203 RepID=UPI00208CE556|nr:hypothetical protein PLICBS_005098 [Purpureocillium lilacinum]